MRRLPELLKKYFWDVDFKEIDLRKGKVFILKRLLEYGDEKAVAWMWKNFKKSEIKDVLHNYRGFSQKSANFWAVVLKIDRKDIKCLNRSFIKTQKLFWPY